MRKAIQAIFWRCILVRVVFWCVLDCLNVPSRILDCQSGASESEKSDDFKRSDKHIEARLKQKGKDGTNNTVEQENP